MAGDLFVGYVVDLPSSTGAAAQSRVTALLETMTAAEAAVVYQYIIGSHILQIGIPCLYCILGISRGYIGNHWGVS